MDERVKDSTPNIPTARKAISAPKRRNIKMVEALERAVFFLAL